MPPRCGPRRRGVGKNKDRRGGRRSGRTPGGGGSADARLVAAAHGRVAGPRDRHRLAAPVAVLAEETAGPLVGDLGVELGQGLVHDLADTLAADADALGDLLERQGLLALEAEAEAEDLRLALVDRIEQAVR